MEHHRATEGLVSNPQVYDRRPGAEAKYLQTTVRADVELVQSIMGGGTSSITEAGVVGAMVTLGTVLIALTVAAFAGFASFGRRQNKGSRHHVASALFEPVGRCCYSMMVSGHQERQVGVLCLIWTLSW